MKMSALALGALAACASARPPAASPPSNTAAAAHPADSIVRDQYVGQKVGIEISHFGRPLSRQHLPDGLERQSVINTADGWHFTVARRGDDLAVLLVDDGGMVTDDVTMIGRARATVIVGDCPDGFIGIAPAGACDRGDTAAVDAAWDRQGSTLIDAGAQTCSCELFRL